MLQASSERSAGLLWVPGMSTRPTMDVGLSARAQEIARRREEMLGMLHDLPESEYELSLTDLVEKAGGGGGGGDGDEAEAEAAAAEAPAPKTEGNKDRSASGEQQQAPAPAAGRPERRASARRRDSGSVGGGSFRSSSDGVLLNFYMPRSLTRSFTAPRPTRTQPASCYYRSPSVASDCNKRERDPEAETVKCWSLLWDRRWRKSTRRDRGAPPSESESTIRAASAAILKAAKHSASPANI